MIAHDPAKNPENPRTYRDTAEISATSMHHDEHFLNYVFSARGWYAESARIAPDKSKMLRVDLGDGAWQRAPLHEWFVLDIASP